MYAKKRIFRRLSIIAAAVIVAFQLGAGLPCAAQGIRLQDDNLTSLLPTGRSAPNLCLSPLDLAARRSYIEKPFEITRLLEIVNRIT